jgi:hypothetical protein
MSVYDEIQAERARQDDKWGGPEHDDQHDFHTWLRLLGERSGLARLCLGSEDPANYRRYLVQIAALAVAAAESFDRLAVAAPAQVGEYTVRRESRPLPPPMLPRLQALVRAHEQEIRSQYAGDLVEEIQHVLAHYQQTATNVVAQTKAFRDDLLVQLRALSLVIEMAGGAGTHREKDARLRGCADLIESTITRLRKLEFGLHRQWYWPDVFRSDYPVRQYVERIHELEAQVQALQPAAAQSASAEPAPEEVPW